MTGSNTVIHKCWEQTANVLAEVDGTPPAAAKDLVDGHFGEILQRFESYSESYGQALLSSARKIPVIGGQPLVGRQHMHLHGS